MYKFEKDPQPKLPQHLLDLRGNMYSSLNLVYLENIEMAEEILKNVGLYIQQIECLAERYNNTAKTAEPPKDQ